MEIVYKEVKTVLYDETDQDSIVDYAKALEGHTFREVLAMNEETTEETYSQWARKGGLGNLIEECYFHYKANSKADADFDKANLELKVSPYVRNKNRTYSAKERLSLSMIPHTEPIDSDLFKSHFWKKNEFILLIYYLHDKSAEDRLSYTIHFVTKFTPTEEDVIIIKQDYEYIAAKVQSGKYHELSESDTYYLGAARKGTGQEQKLPQFYPPFSPTNKRAFAYKQSYMTYVLRNYIIKEEETAEPIVKNIAELRAKTFAHIVLDTIMTHKGETIDSIKKQYNITYSSKKKDFYSALVFKMLGIRSNSAEEFEKANIEVKAIRIPLKGNKKDKKEEISLPVFSFKELANETWETSTIRKVFSSKKYLWVIFRETRTSGYVLDNSYFWNMPYEDLENYASEDWQRAVNIINEGIKFDVMPYGNRGKVVNNLPGSADTHIFYIKAHATHRYYILNDGTTLIDDNATQADKDQLPSGEWVPRSSFWLKRAYIFRQLGIDE